MFRNSAPWYRPQATGLIVDDADGRQCQACGEWYSRNQRHNLTRGDDGATRCPPCHATHVEVVAYRELAETLRKRRVAKIRGDN